MILIKLRNAHLQLSAKKYVLFQKEANFCGNVSTEEITTDPDKIKAVQDWPKPKSNNDVRSFLCLCSYYSRFVKAFGKVAKPLHSLAEKNKMFSWTAEYQQAFNSLKKWLITTPIFPSFIPMLLTIALERPFLRSLGKAGRNYCVTINPF